MSTFEELCLWVGAGTAVNFDDLPRSYNLILTDPPNHAVSLADQKEILQYAPLAVGAESSLRLTPRDGGYVIFEEVFDGWNNAVQAKLEHFPLELEYGELVSRGDGTPVGDSWLLKEMRFYCETPDDHRMLVAMSRWEKEGSPFAILSLWRYSRA